MSSFKSATEFSGVSATSLITLLARADESVLSDSLLCDPYASAAVETLAFDVSRFRLSRDGVVCLAIRAKTLDDWSREFLSRQPDSVVIHLGCGLDSRFYRIQPDARVRWFNVDLPDVIQARRKIYPSHSEDRLIEASVTSADWLEQIPVSDSTLIIAEGLFPYFEQAEVQRLVRQLLNRFPSGELLFDSYRRWGIWALNRHHSIRRTGARLRWGLDDPRELECWDHRLTLVTNQTRHDPAQIARLSSLLRWLNRIPVLRNSASLLRYRFRS